MTTEFGWNVPNWHQGLSSVFIIIYVFLFFVYFHAIASIFYLQFNKYKYFNPPKAVNCGSKATSTHKHTVVQSRKSVSACTTSEQILRFGFVEKSHATTHVCAFWYLTWLSRGLTLLLLGPYNLLHVFKHVSGPNKRSVKLIALLWWMLTESNHSIWEMSILLMGIFFRHLKLEIAWAIPPLNDENRNKQFSSTRVRLTSCL